MTDAPPPVYASWSDYINRTTYSERMGRCNAASKRANRVHRCFWPRNFDERDPASIWFKEKICGSCAHCGALPQTQCLGSNKLSGRDVWSLMEMAKGRCMYCSSLAVERRPSVAGHGYALPWANIGRRIGSLEHIDPFLDGRINHLANLGWSCLWCNVHRDQRVPFAPDHGGYYPGEPIPAETLAETLPVSLAPMTTPFFEAHPWPGAGPDAINP